MSSVPETRFTLPNGPASSSSIFSSIWELFFGSPKKSTTDSSASSRPTETRMIAAKKCKPRVRTRPSHGWECSDDGKDTKKAMIYCPYSKPKPEPSDEGPSCPVEEPPRLPVGIGRPLPDPSDEGPSRPGEKWPHWWPGIGRPLPDRSDIPPATDNHPWPLRPIPRNTNNGGRAPSIMDQHEVPIQRGPRRRNVGSDRDPSTSNLGDVPNSCQQGNNSDLVPHPRVFGEPGHTPPPRPWHDRDPMNGPSIDSFPSPPGGGITALGNAIGTVIVGVAYAVKKAVVWFVTHPKMPHVVGVMAVGAACYYAYKWWCPETAVPVEN
jgi:hypothetical protein